jgi:hypothetical protein
MEARGPYCPVDLVMLVTMLKDAALPWRESMWVLHAIVVGEGEEWSWADCVQGLEISAKPP